MRYTLLFARILFHKVNDLNTGPPVQTPLPIIFTPYAYRGCIGQSSFSLDNDYTDDYSHLV